MAFVMPYATSEKKRESQRRWGETQRAAAHRLRIAIRVMAEYGCLWEYERACDDEGLTDPLRVPASKRAA